MANITQTQYVNYITMYGGKLDHFEQRGSVYGALRLFQNESDPNDPQSIITPRLYENVKKSFGIPVKEPVMDYFKPTVSTTRVCTFETEGVVSNLVTLVFNTYRAGFVIARADNMNNYVDYQSEWNRAFDGVIEQFGRALDSDAISTLETNKNTYWTGVAPDYYTQTGDVLQVAQADKNDFYNQLQSIYQSMDFYGQDIRIVGSPKHNALVRYYSNQGAGNAINYNFQFGPYSWYPSNRVTLDSGAESTVYAMPKGSVGMITRLDPAALMRSRIHEGDYWDVMEGVPIMNSTQMRDSVNPARIDLGVHYQAKCADISSIKAAALSGLTAAKAESWTFSFDVVFMVAHNSRAEASPPTDFGPILKADILTT